MAKTAVSQLQEICQKESWSFPTYIDKGGIGEDHAKIFTFQLNLLDQTFIGEGSTKKAAKQNAAEKALQTLVDANGVVKCNQICGDVSCIDSSNVEACGRSETDSTGTSDGDNAISQLYEYCQKYGHKPPTFDELSQDVTGGTSKFVFSCVLPSLRIVESACATSKRAAKKFAAEKALNRLKSQDEALLVNGFNKSLKLNEKRNHLEMTDTAMCVRLKFFEDLEKIVLHQKTADELLATDSNYIAVIERYCPELDCSLKFFEFVDESKADATFKCICQVVTKDPVIPVISSYATDLESKEMAKMKAALKCLQTLLYHMTVLVLDPATS